MGTSADLGEYEPLLRATARHLCRTAWETDDLVQDTFERALRYLSAGKPPPAQPRPWLVSILRHAFIDKIRQRKLAGEPLDEQVVAPEHEPGPLWADVSLDEIRSALGGIAVEQRRAFELHYIDGLRYRDVAARLGIAENTVASRLSRARSALRVVLTGIVRGAQP